jgi:hypothetical protein
LQQPGGDHRLHQIAPAAERQILIDIGNRAKVLGYKKLAPYTREGVKHTIISNFVGSELALEHMSAGNF